VSGRGPAYVITQWVSPQLRERYPDLPLSLTEATAAAGAEVQAAAEAEAEPEAEI
jgi:hypothetical protein